MATSRLIQAGLAALDYVVKKNEGCVCSISKLDRNKNFIGGISYVVSVQNKSKSSGNIHSSTIVHICRENQKWIILSEYKFVETVR